MKSFLPWMCKCRTSACLLALVLIWTCTSVHAGIPCENNCLQTDNHQADCEVIGCRNGCKPGWYGSLCNKRCGRRCQDVICNQDDGKCIKGCKGRWFCRGGSRVLRDIDAANERCLRKSVDNQKTCECCISRYRGPNCSILCENCETFKQSNICKYMCKSGYYGDTCNMTCSENCATGNFGTHLCEETGDGTVQCSNGCIRGRYGKYCSNSCSQSCRNNTCFKKDGTCVECSDNRYGSYCNISCSEKCIDDRCQRNGTCIDGCEEGYSGSKCDQKCSVSCTGGLCYQNGTCWPSCENGFYGELCKMKCGKNCFNSSCQAQTGNRDLTFVCTHGCEDGFMGSQCQEQCPEHCTNCSKLPHFSSCKHTSGNHGGFEKGSLRPLLLWHVVVLIVLIIIAVVIIIIVVICCKKRGHFKRRKPQTDGNTYEGEIMLTQNLTENEQHPSDENDNKGKRRGTHRAGNADEAKSFITQYDTRADQHSRDETKHHNRDTGLRESLKVRAFPFEGTRDVFAKRTDANEDEAKGSTKIATVSNADDKEENQTKDTDKGEHGQAWKDDLNKPEDPKTEGIFPFEETKNKIKTNNE